MLNSIKLLIKSNYYLFKAARFLPALFGFYKRRVDLPLDDFWKKRIELVVESPDNAFIERVPDAGTIVNDVQLMHNGLWINVGSYYGDGNTVLLYKNRGVHEPQEERAFKEILDCLPQEAVMLELGAFWGFYSMTFLQKIKRGKSYLIEPDSHSLLSGRNNFRLNNLKGRFFNYYVSDCEENGTVPTISINSFLRQQKIDHVNILHSDIQGFELKMLQGAAEFLEKGSIDYVFISTHSNELHEDCKSLLIEFQYQILCDANLDETYSWDGLIVAKREVLEIPVNLTIHKRAC
jgi:hypothetical protein